MAYRITGVLLLANRAIGRASLERVHDERTIVRVEMGSLTLTSVENLLRKLSQLTCVFESRALIADLEGRFNARLVCSMDEGISMHVLSGAGSCAR